MEQLVSSGSGPQGPGQNKKRSPKPQAPSFKRHEKNTIKKDNKL